MVRIKPAGFSVLRWDENHFVHIITVATKKCYLKFTYYCITLAGGCYWANEHVLSSPPPDHKGPEVVDYRWWDAANRLMHPHLLADCGPTQEDRGRIQFGGQCAFWCFSHLAIMTRFASAGRIPVSQILAKMRQCFWSLGKQTIRLRL